MHTRHLCTHSHSAWLFSCLTHQNSCALVTVLLLLLMQDVEKAAGGYRGMFWHAIPTSSGGKVWWSQVFDRVTTHVPEMPWGGFLGEWLYCTSCMVWEVLYMSADYLELWHLEVVCCVVCKWLVSMAC